MRSFLLALLSVISISASSQKSFLFIGGYNDKAPGKGIYVYSFDAATGKASWISNTEGIVNPSYLTVDPQGKFVYACTDTRTPGAGSVSAFSFDKKTGAIQFINKQPAGGDNPVYISLHKTRKWVTIGTYTSGTLAVFPLNEDGSLRPFTQNIQHTGNSIRPNQTKPHVHAVVFSPSHDRLFVPDLGLDKIKIYRFNDKSATPLQDTTFTSTKPGGGPRHFTFHPNGKYAYLLEEMGGAVMAYRYNAAKGKLDSLQRILTHPADSVGSFHSADIHVSPDGKFLYASNRTRQNNIAIFSIDKNSGKLKLLGYESTRGTTPRNFVIDPSGKYLLVANQGSGNIVIFKRNLQTGLLTATGEEIKAPEPTCLKMLAR